MQGAHAVFRLGKPSFKKENLLLVVIGFDLGRPHFIFR